ncbi:unnamed protein product [Closterium sp. Naga37s-1]|nr:unnamed protein product [Closterium sp. Naga37s-1]
MLHPPCPRCHSPCAIPPYSFAHPPLPLAYHHAAIFPPPQSHLTKSATLNATPMPSVRMPPRLLRRCRHCRSSAALSPVVRAAEVVGNSPLPSPPHGPTVPRGELSSALNRCQWRQGQGREVGGKRGRWAADGRCGDQEMAAGDGIACNGHRDPRFNPDPPRSAPRQRTFPPPLRVPLTTFRLQHSPPPPRSRKTRADG